MSKYNIDTKKKAFIKALEVNQGNIKATCEKLNMARSTYYLWRDDDKDFETEIENVNEGLLDFAESQLHQKINQGNLTAIIFYLKCKGQTRGYIDKQYIEKRQMTEPIKVFKISQDEVVVG